MAALLPCFRNKILASARGVAELGILLACASASFASPMRHSPHPQVVGYFSNSNLRSTSPFYIKDLVTNGDAKRLDQINYASASVRGGRCSLSDITADLATPFSADQSVNGVADNPASHFLGYFHQLAELKRRYPRIKVLISLEGRASDFAIDAQPENRAAFVRSCVDLYLRGRFADGVNRPGLFDGIDLDWESPHAEDAANFEALIKEFRRQMNSVRPGMRFTVAVGQTPRMLPGTDFKSLANLVDQFGVMNYDYAGPWSPTTGLIAPLFSDAFLDEQGESIEHSIDDYLQAGVPARKLLMGLPFYGYGWTGVTATNNGLFQTGRGVRGDRPYSFIRSLVQPADVYRDARSQAPWIFDGQNFWTYEDPVSIRYKVSFAAEQKLGGVMVWELSQDTPNGELLSTAYTALRHPLPPKVFLRSEEPVAGDSAATIRGSN